MTAKNKMFRGDFSLMGALRREWAWEGPSFDANPMPKKAKALSRAVFPERGTGLL
jgi:hypothetical protein